jgi:hypothetical protein
MGMEEDDYPEVLLDGLSDLFQDPKSWYREKGLVDMGVGPHTYLIYHCLQMKAAGWDIDIDEVAAVSGASALFGYEQGSYRPKYAFRRIDPVKRIAEATGFGIGEIHFDSAEGAWDVTKESLDSGRPVKGEHFEAILFAGYQDAANRDDRRVFAISEGPGDFTRSWTWKEFVSWVMQWSHGKLERHTARVVAAGPKSTAIRVIKALVEWSEKPPDDIQFEYNNAVFGLTGIEAYANACEDMEKYPGFGMCHDMNSQWPTRKSSAVYLEGVVRKGLFPEKLNEDLLTASKEYLSAYQSWVNVYNKISWAVPEELRQARADLVKQLKSTTDPSEIYNNPTWISWVKDRASATQSIREALSHEKAAIAALKNVLASL